MKQKRQMTSLDVAALVAELKSLEGGHVNKFYQIGENRFALSVRAQDTGRTNIIIELPYWLFASGADFVPIEPPPTFIMGLRKHISNAYVSSVAQHDFDRIVVFNLSKRDNYQLVVELFSKGNIVLVKEGEILHPLRSQSWSHRMVKRGEPFDFPPPRANPLVMELEEFVQHTMESNKDIVKALAMDVNLGGELAEEVCARAGVDKRAKAVDLEDGVLASLFQAMKEVIQIGTTAQEPRLYSSDEGLSGFSPTPYVSYETADTSQERATTLSEAIERYREQAPGIGQEEDEDAASEEAQRLERLLASQEASIVQFEETITLAHAKGDAIYTNYQLLESLLERLKAARETGSLDDDMEEFRDIPMIKSIDAANAMVTVQLDGMEIALHFLETIHKNAELYYEESKKAKDKLAGAREAHESALRQRKRAQERMEARPEVKKPHRKRFWFEKFRWFISSEGNVVIGGRDARSNEQVVKKYLDFGDRYAHADIHGSPSVVVKGECTETSLKEACEFAASFSKAWSGSLGSVSTYWVLPEQVSKTPQSGEFVAKGSFIIRGKKNYFHKTTLFVAIGLVSYEGEELLMCGPVGAVKRLSKKYVVLSPGQMKKESLAKKLAAAFDSGVDHINGLLPPGGCEVLETNGLSMD